MSVSSSSDVPFSCQASYVALSESCHVMRIRVSMCVGIAKSGENVVVDDQIRIAQTRVVHP